MTPAKYAATIVNLRNQDIRGGPPHDQTRLPDDSDALHDRPSGEGRQHHQRRCPQERCIEFRERREEARRPEVNRRPSSAVPLLVARPQSLQNSREKIT
jgi:hypothetical protein